MIFEHWIYSVAFAVVFGLFYYRLTGRDFGWIIVASSYAPDIDFVAGSVLEMLGVSVFFHGSPIGHGDFHNIAFMFLYGVFVAFLLQIVGIRFRDSFIFASVGFAAHMFEDALVFNPAYCFFWPFSSQEFGLGLLDYSYDLFGIADSQVLVLGLFMVALCVLLRTVYEGGDWLKRACSITQQSLD